MLTIQPRLRIKQISTSELVPYAGNAKLHPEKQVAEIAESIEQFGFNDPVGIWHDPETGEPVIVEGHGRLLAAERLGIDKVPTISLDHLDDEARRAYVLVHNQTTMSSGFDIDLLQRELDKITGLDMSRFGFEPASVLEDLPEAIEEIPEAPEARTKPGDLWVMGEHRLLCGDSTEPEELARLMGGEQADLLLTDPPYGVAYEGKTAEALTIDNDSFGSDQELEDFLAAALTAAAAHLKAGGAFYTWFATRQTIEATNACIRAGLDVKQEIYWVKGNITLGRQDYQWQTEPCLYGWKDGAAHWFAPTRSEHNVVDALDDIAGMTKAELKDALTAILTGEGGIETDALRHDKPAANREHPTMKPVALFARLVRNSSRPGEVVFDPFGGLGTTLVACESLGRKARLMEIDPHYCDVIVARWEAVTGLTATRE